jgi:hypothetical protein
LYATLLRPQFPSHLLHANVSISYEYTEEVKKSIPTKHARSQMQDAFTKIKSIIQANALKKPFEISKMSAEAEKISNFGSILGIDLNRIVCMRQAAYGLISLGSPSTIDLWDLNIPFQDATPIINAIMGLPIQGENQFISKIMSHYLSSSSLSQPAPSHPFGGWKTTDEEILTKKGLAYPHDAYEAPRDPTLADLFGALIYYYGIKREHLLHHIFAVIQKLEHTKDTKAIPRLRSELYYLKKKFNMCRPKMLDIMIRETALLILSTDITAVAGENLRFQKTVGSLAKIIRGMVKGVGKFWTPVTELVEANGGIIPRFKLVSPWGTSKYDLFNSAALGLHSIDLENFSLEEVEAIFEEKAPPPTPDIEKDFAKLKKYIKAVLCLDDSATSADWGVTADLESQTELWRVTPRHDSSGVSIAARYIEEVSKSRKKVKKALVIHELLKRFFPHHRLKVFPGYDKEGGHRMDFLEKGIRITIIAQFIRIVTTEKDVRVAEFAFESGDMVEIMLPNVKEPYAYATHIHCTPLPPFFLRKGDIYTVSGENAEYNKKFGKKGFGMCNCTYDHVA